MNDTSQFDSLTNLQGSQTAQKTPILILSLTPLRTYKALKRDTLFQTAFPGLTPLRTYKALKHRLRSLYSYFRLTPLRTYKALKL